MKGRPTDGDTNHRPYQGERKRNNALPPSRFRTAYNHQAIPRSCEFPISTQN